MKAEEKKEFAMSLLQGIVEQNKGKDISDILSIFARRVNSRNRQAKRDEENFAEFLVQPGRARVYIRIDSAKFLLDLSEDAAFSWAVSAASMGAQAWVLMLRTRKTKTGRRVPIIKKTENCTRPVYKRIFPDGVEMSEAEAVELETEFSEVTPQSVSNLSGISDLLEQIPGWTPIQESEKKASVVEKVPARRVAPDASWMTKKGWNFGSATTIRKDMAKPDPTPRAKKPAWTWWLEHIEPGDEVTKDSAGRYCFSTYSIDRAGRMRFLVEEKGEKNPLLLRPRVMGPNATYKVFWG
jgi:hypothetical protein